MKPRPAIDVSGLPTLVFGPRDPLWWGVAGMIAIESSMFALAVVVYSYLRGGAVEWPPPGAEMPRLVGIANLAVLLVSAVPMHLANRAALRGSLRPMRRWLLVTTLIGIGVLVLRVFEFSGMTFRWNHHAYGSIVWTIFGFHTLHLLTSCLENLLLLVLLFRGPVEENHRQDLRLNGMFWFFVVASWVALFAILYGDGRP